MEEKIGGIIKNRRIELGMTQKQLADCLYVTDKAVSKWERGICYPDVELLQSLSEALKIPIEKLAAARYPNVISKKIIKRMVSKYFFLLTSYMIIGLILYCIFFSNPTVLINVKRIYVFGAIVSYNMAFFLLFKFVTRRIKDANKSN